MRYTNLPFVGTSNTKKRLSFWTPPATGNFVDGTRTGKAMADAYIAHLSTTQGAPPLLPQVIVDMLNASEIPEALHGQLVGFLSAIEDHLSNRR